MTYTPAPAAELIAETMSAHAHWMRCVADELDGMAREVMTDASLAGLVEGITEVARQHPYTHELSRLWIAGLDHTPLQEELPSPLARFGCEDYWPDTVELLQDVLAAGDAVPW